MNLLTWQYENQARIISFKSAADSHSSFHFPATEFQVIKRLRKNKIKNHVHIQKYQNLITRKYKASYLYLYISKYWGYRTYSKQLI